MSDDFRSFFPRFCICFTVHIIILIVHFFYGTSAIVLGLILRSDPHWRPDTNATAIGGHPITYKMAFEAAVGVGTFEILLGVLLLAGVIKRNRVLVATYFVLMMTSFACVCAAFVLIMVKTDFARTVWGEYLVSLAFPVVGVFVLTQICVCLFYRGLREEKSGKEWRKFENET